jgi:hypothetical protein
MINFVLSQFLDGVQIWKKKVAQFAPSLINVLNLPLRTEGNRALGYSLFLLLHAKQVIDGQVVEIDNQKYFVQARLKITILDTAGLKGFLYLANPRNSHWGCWSCRFNSVPGEHTRSVYVWLSKD